MKVIVTLCFLLSNCGVGYYKAESDHEAEVNTNKTTDVYLTCRPLLGPDGVASDDAEAKRYLQCVKHYSPNTSVVDPETAEAAAGFISALEPESVTEVN